MIENIGMMDEGYFVSRSEILTWVNTLLQVIILLIFLNFIFSFIKIIVEH